MFGRMPICDHMSDVPVCPLSYQPICGTDKTTYSNDCLLCVARMKTKKDIQILREGPC
uniref:Kazal-like domain-containing protein n=1 Tax=Ornithorhynchus anatinus TaxID=9258 RepID=A0A6I8NES7_ORNAN